MFRKAVAVLGLMACAIYSHAAPIAITQTFSSVSYTDYGVADGVGYAQTPTGDWVFKGTVDSNAVNISPWSGIGAYQLTKLTLTQASLGLFDIGITNAPVLFFYPDSFGFAFNAAAAAAWTVIFYEPNHFSSATTLDEYLALITTPPPTAALSGFGPQWDGFALEDGRRLYGTGWDFGVPKASTAAVPEPSSLPLLLVALGLLACSTYRREEKQ